MVPHTIELAEELLEEGRKVVIGCCYDEELYSLKEYFGDRCVVYNGKMNSKQKDAAKGGKSTKELLKEYEEKIAYLEELTADKGDDFSFEEKD